MKIGVTDWYVITGACGVSQCVYGVLQCVYGVSQCAYCVQR